MKFDEYLESAIKAKKSVTIRYVKYGGEYSERKISDIQHSSEFGVGYISAYCHKRQDNRTFKIDRIVSIDGIANPNKAAMTSVVASQHSKKSGIQSATFRSQPNLTKTSFSATTQSNSNHSNNFKPKSKSEGCYIATMAYGSYDHPQVLVLRNYRDHILLKSEWGKIFVTCYYFISPFMVKELHGHRWINSIIRKCLDTFIKRIVR